MTSFVGKAIKPASEVLMTKSSLFGFLLAVRFLFPVAAYCDDEVPSSISRELRACIISLFETNVTRFPMEYSDLKLTRVNSESDAGLTLVATFSLNVRSAFSASINARESSGWSAHLKFQITEKNLSNPITGRHGIAEECELKARGVEAENILEIIRPRGGALFHFP